MDPVTTPEVARPASRSREGRAREGRARRSDRAASHARRQNPPGWEDLEHRRALVSQLPLFAGLDAVIIGQLAEAAELRRLAPGEPAIRAGESADHFFGVAFGQVQLLLAASGDEPSVLALEGPGSTFGEASMWLGVASPLSARATQDSLLLAFPRGAFEWLVRRYPALSVRFISCISQRLNNLVANLGSHKQKSGEQRLAAYLLGLPNIDGDEAQPRVRLPASKGTIASLVSIQPETLSRILKRFQQNGWIEMRGRELLITERRGLRGLVGDSTSRHSTSRPD
jgi:CRP-like cAMP-binding protein